MRNYRSLVWIIGLSLLLLTQSVMAQSVPPYQVFVLHHVDESDMDRLIFVNTVTGEEISTDVFGTQYTIAGDNVMFFDTSARRVKLASADGIVRDHPFINTDSSTYRIDWIVSSDNALVAWTVTQRTAQAGLITYTTVSDIDGILPRQILVDGPLDGIRALPIAFSDDQTLLYMDYQPDGIGDITPFTQYAGIFSVNVPQDAQGEVGAPTFLPGEPGCFCGGGIGAGWLLRLSLTDDLTGYNLRVHHLLGDIEQTIPALPLRNYTQAGDFLISPDGTRAVYALANVEGFGTANQSVTTVFALVDLQDMSQALLGDAITTFVHPIAWTEDNTGLIFVTPERDGTWKLSIVNGTLTNIADATYIGTLR
ncbi:MAG: hypothetical protein U0694_16810 [Anaerolineae bacterium]